MGTIYTYIGPTGVGYYSTILPALQSASQATGVPLGILEGMALRESTWGQTRYPNFLSLFAGRVPPFTYANIDPNTVSGQALAAARYLANLAQQCGGWTGGLCAYNAGHCIGGSCAYSDAVMQYVRVSTTYAAPVLTISPSFGASGSASVTPGGRINGTLRLSAAHGTVSYKVTMWVTPTYNTTYPTSTTVTGSATNTTINVNQSLIAPLPSPEVIRSYQQIHSGPIAFHYTVNWTVTDQTGASKTVSAGKVVTLTVQ